MRGCKLTSPAHSLSPEQATEVSCTSAGSAQVVRATSLQHSAGQVQTLCLDLGAASMVPCVLATSAAAVAGSLCPVARQPWAAFVGCAAGGITDDDSGTMTRSAEL